MLLSLLMSCHDHTQALHPSNPSPKGKDPIATKNSDLWGGKHTSAVLSHSHMVTDGNLPHRGVEQSSLPGCTADPRGLVTVFSCCLGSADPKRTWSGICVAPATAILAIQETSTLHSVLVWQKGVLRQCRVQKVLPAQDREKDVPAGCLSHCSVAPSLSELLFFCPLQPGPVFPLALRHPLSG